jgi:hypothetical protein
LFESRTDSFYFLNGLEFSAGRFKIEANLPVIAQNTPWISYGPTPIPSGGSQSGEVSRQTQGRGQMQGSGGPSSSVIQLPSTTFAYETAIGDPFVWGDVVVLRASPASLEVRVGGAVKLPLAEPDDGFGTGELDYSGGLSISALASPRDAISADLSYWMLGDMPDLAFKNALGYGLAYSRSVSSGRWSVLGSVNGMTTVLENTSAPVQLGIGLTRFLDTGHSFTVTVGAGLTETAPDFSVGVGWRLLTRRR